MSWLQEHWHLVEDAGLPADVIVSEEKFTYFITYTYNQDGWLGIAPWFSVEGLPVRERQAL